MGTSLFLDVTGDYTPSQRMFNLWCWPEKATSHPEILRQNFRQWHFKNSSKDDLFSLEVSWIKKLIPVSLSSLVFFVCFLSKRHRAHAILSAWQSSHGVQTYYDTPMHPRIVQFGKIQLSLIVIQTKLCSSFFSRFLFLLTSIRKHKEERAKGQTFWFQWQLIPIGNVKWTQVPVVLWDISGWRMSDKTKPGQLSKWL